MASGSTRRTTQRTSSLVESRRVAAALLEALRTAAPRRHEVSDLWHRVLDVVATHDGLTLTELAGHLGCHVASASRTTDRMVEAGMLAKTRGASTDPEGAALGRRERAVHFQLTAAGRATRRDRAHSLARRLRPALDQLTPAARAGLLEHLDQLTAALQHLE